MKILQRLKNGQPKKIIGYVLIVSFGLFVSVCGLLLHRQIIKKALSETNFSVEVEELEPFTIYAVKSEKGGMTGSFVKTEWINANPWQEETQLSTLPVFRNTWESNENYANANANPVEMQALLIEIAKRLGFKTSQYEIESSIAQMYAKLDGMEIVVNSEMIVRIYFNAGVALPVKYNMSNTASYEQVLDVAQYLQKKYKKLINMKDPQINVTNGYYDSKGYSISFFEGDTDLTGQIVNYNFNQIVFSGDKDGLLSMITIYRPDLSQKVGDYPIVSVNDAKKILAEGYFYTKAGSWTRDEQGNRVFNSPDMEGVKHVELIYDSDSNHNLYIPYYAFYAGVYYYVPAINPHYIINMPQGEYPSLE